MIIFDLLRLYRSLESQKTALIKQVKETQYRRLFRKQSNGVMYYFERKKVDGKVKACAISEEEYRRFLIESYRHMRAEEELREVEIILRKGAKKAAMYERKLRKYNAALVKISQLEPLPKPSAYRADELKYTTLRGEKVRSKSEAFICDALRRHGIWYRYEQKFEAWPFLPDFYIIDSVRGKPVIWEHFGLIDDPDYLQKTIEKIMFYEKNGFVIGDNLIITTEPFDAEKAEMTVRKYLSVEQAAA